MKRQRGETSSGGIGIFGLLGVVFVVLKILDVKPIGDWSWWWVTAPFWGGFALFLLIAGGALAFVWWARR
jgi:hypothetical protein